MKSLAFLALVLHTGSFARAAIIGEECEPKTAELRLARACYTGAMDVGPTQLRYLGIETDAQGKRYCQNTLLLTSTTNKPPSSRIQAVKDETGQVRVHNYAVPTARPGDHSLVLANLPSTCMDRPNIDSPCWTSNSLKVTYSGTPGSGIEITGTEPVRDDKVKITPELNADQNSPALAKALVDDIDGRIDAAARSVREAASARVVKDRNLIKERAKQVMDCWEQSRKFRSAKSLAKVDAADDADRKKLLDAVQVIQSTGLAPAVSTGAGAGSAR